jgi:hypothetical protein
MKRIYTKGSLNSKEAKKQALKDISNENKQSVVIISNIIYDIYGINQEHLLMNPKTFIKTYINDL